MQIPSRSSPSAASITISSSSSVRPTVPPAPAAFSSRIGHGGASASSVTSARSSAVVSAAATLVIAVSTPAPLWLPMCSTSPEDPMPLATERLLIRHSTLRVYSTSSGVARLIR